MNEAESIRRERIATTLSDLFWSEMVEPLTEPKPMTREAAHRFVIGIAANRQCDYLRAIRLPDALAERLGTNDIVQGVLRAGLDGVIRAMTEKPMLHRFPRELAKSVHAIAFRIQTEYGGDYRVALNKPGRTVSGMVEELMALRGIGRKCALLGTRVLLLSWGIALLGDSVDEEGNRLSSLASLDCAPDVHVRRVFHRLGLVAADATPEQVVQVARDLRPEEPCAMDAAWIVGIDRCHAKRGCADCNRCPLGGVSGPCSWNWADAAPLVEQYGDSRLAST